MDTRREVIRKRASGQSIAVVGLLLGLGVLIGFVAIAMDGGSALLQRRVMQNAADAGALAGVQLLSEHVLITASEDGESTYTTYPLTNTLLVNAVQTLAAQNRGGDIGATVDDYTLEIYYHYMEGHPTYPNAFGPDLVVADGAFIPDYVDGIKVVSTIRNPTTFARALPVAITDIESSAASAMALYPTCRPAPPSGPGTTLPFTRYRYSFERELPAKANNLCEPFIFWSGQSDVEGPGNNSIKNKISFNTRSFFLDADPWLTPASTEQQLLSGFDHRYGNPPFTDGADMRGSAVDNGNSASTDVRR
jgi:hypothetical protein